MPVKYMNTEKETSDSRNKTSAYTDIFMYTVTWIN